MAPPAPRAGRLGHYELLERLGHGGMAEVFRARASGAGGFEKIVVIKRILPHLADDPATVKMFVEEAKLAGRARHKNVVQVYELEKSDDGELYMVMEHVPGVDLRVLLKQADRLKLRLPIWFSMHVLAEVLGGLAHVHALMSDDGRPLKVVHRDVTPSNVFVSLSGEVKLGDFGIAKSDFRTNVTRPGEVKGKLGYMAPELLRGLALDGRADVFGAGVVLWECLAQRRLFAGKPRDVMKAICQAPRAPPSACNPGVPPALDACVLSALEHDRDLRTQSARAFQEELHSILSILRPHILFSEVRQTVELLLGRAQPDSPSGALERLGPESAVSWIDSDEDSAFETDTREKDVAAEDATFDDGRKVEPSIDLGATIQDPEEDLLASSTEVGTAPKPYGLFVMKEGGEVSGPTDWATLEPTLGPPARGGRGPRLSADGARWVDLEAFAVLTGQEMLLRESRLPGASSILGNLEYKSLSWVFGLLRGLKATGRLILVRETSRALERRDLHVLKGAPSFVYANEPELQAPELLVKSGRIERRQIGRLIHRAVRENRPIEELVVGEGEPTDSIRAELMRHRLSEMFRWRSGRFMFDGQAPAADRAPFAPSLLAVVVEMVTRSFSLEELEAALLRDRFQVFRASERFGQMKELALDPAQVEVARLLAQGSNLNVARARMPDRKKEALVAAYVLIETEMLVRPQA